MPNLDLVTFEDIYTDVLRLVKGNPDDQESVDKVKSSINARHRTIANKKKWKWLRETRRSLRLRAEHTAGLVTLTNGSVIVNGTSSPNWTDTFRHWWLAPQGMDATYRAISVPSSTQLLLATPYVGPNITNGKYSLFQSEVALFPDLDDIDDMRIEGTRWAIDPRGPAEINLMRQRWPRMKGRPRFYTIEGEALFQGPVLGQFVLGFDFLGQGMTKAVHFFPPIPDKEYTIHVPYKKQISTLVNPGDQPLIPLGHRIILRHYAMADWYSSNGQDNKAAYYERLGNEELKDMIEKYVDTDDRVQFRAMQTGGVSHSRLMRGSQTYFDTEG